MRIALLVIALAGGLSCAIAQPSTKTTPKAATTVAANSEADRAGKAVLVERLMADKSYLFSRIIDKCFTFSMSPSCWAVFNDPANDTKSSGFDAANYWVLALIDYAKREGMGDLKLLNVSGGGEKANRPQMDEIVSKLATKFSMRIEAPIVCTPMASKLVTRYAYEVLKRVGTDAPDWSPKSGEAHFTVVLSPSATDMSVKISPDGKQFTVTGPALTEAYSTPNKIAAGLDKANKNR